MILFHGAGCPRAGPRRRCRSTSGAASPGGGALGSGCCVGAGARRFKPGPAAGCPRAGPRRRCRSTSGAASPGGGVPLERTVPSMPERRKAILSWGGALWSSGGALGSGCCVGAEARQFKLGPVARCPRAGPRRRCRSTSGAASPGGGEPVGYGARFGAGALCRGLYPGALACRARGPRRRSV